MRQIPKIASTGVVLLAVGQGAKNAAAQCSMCRTGLLNSPEGQQLIAGFNSGILFLLAVPVVIFLSVLFLLWRASRKRLRSLAQRASAPCSENLALAMALPAGKEPTSPPEELTEPA